VSLCEYIIKERFVNLYIQVNKLHKYTLKNATTIMYYQGTAGWLIIWLSRMMKM